MLKQSFLISIVLASIIIQIISKLSREKVLLAINCGGNSFTDSQGIIYQKVFLLNMMYIKTHRIKTSKEAKFLISDQALNLN